MWYHKDIQKLQEQIPIAYVDRAQGIFTCCGNQLWQEGPTQQWPSDWRLIYENKGLHSTTFLHFYQMHIYYI